MCIFIRKFFPISLEYYQRRCEQNMSTQPQQPDVAKQKLIHQQLVLLLHAERCQKRENDDPSVTCELPRCGTMRVVLLHLADCKEGEDCRVPLCVSSCKVMNHWKNCVRAECHVCSPLRQVNNENENNTLVQT